MKLGVGTETKKEGRQTEFLIMFVYFLKINGPEATQLPFSVPYYLS